MLKRALVLLSGTITGLVGVLSYNPPHIAGALSTPVAPTDQPISPEAQSTTDKSSSGTTRNEPTRKAPPASTSKSKNSASVSAERNSAPTTTQTQPSTVAEPAGSSGTFQGNTVSTKYGPVQVQIMVQNGQITNAEALAYPTRDRRSMQISQAVIPWLSQETVRIQSASVMAVSGATITTNAWNNSLASALQKAGK